MNLEKRSFSLAGHRTSVALEAEFWATLEGLAQRRAMRLLHLVVEVDAARGDRPLASALRLAALRGPHDEPPPDQPVGTD